MSQADPGLVELLQRLIRIPSVNPAFADDARIGGERLLAEFVSDLLAKAGFRVEWVEEISGRPNVIARHGPDSPSRTILLEAHLDTQGVHGMVVPPFEGLIREGRVYGRGACDTKGPLAAALWSLTSSRLAAAAEQGVQVIFVGAIGEEKGNLGAEQLVERGLGADEALILEPTECAVVRAHKGTLWYELEVIGRAAHGSAPERGVSAIGGMIHALKEIETEARQAAAARPNGVLGSPTLNIGVIRGGTAINIVPERCVVEIDRRTVPGESTSAILESVREGLARLKRQGLLVDWILTTIKDGPPFETSAESRLIRRLCAAAESEGLPPRVEGAPWFSDAGPFSRTCREVAVFGPGSIRQAHTADEHIEIAELARGSRILGEFFDQLAQEMATRC
ncbi:MAG: M20 family metallopeptidase [Kiritimatiellae bacterium]|nr:M20 family metallopeptidase [Kiritimatiellia bacterium]MDW8458457.1 M20 family metallopeptidase [Verrucomicrobiota bacterium]